MAGSLSCLSLLSFLSFTLSGPRERAHDEDDEDDKNDKNDKRDGANQKKESTCARDLRRASARNFRAPGILSLLSFALSGPCRRADDKNDKRDGAGKKKHACEASAGHLSMASESQRAGDKLQRAGG